MIRALIRVQTCLLKIRWLILLCLLGVSCAAGGFLALLLSGPGGLPIVPVFIVPGARQLVTTSSHPLVRFFTEPQVAAATPDDCNIDPKVYVTNLRSNSVSVIDVLMDRVIANIPVGRNPFAIAITPDCSKAYVGNFGDIFTRGNTISVIDVKMDKVIKTITVGFNPGAIAITPDGSKAYVANSGISSSDDTVSVIDVVKDTVIALVTVGISPGDIAVTPDGSKVYVTNSISSTVSVIKAATNKVIDTINVGFQPAGIAITPNGSKAYVANLASNTVSVIDVSEDRVIATIPVGLGPLIVAITPDGSNVYVTNLNSDSVSVISVSIDTVIKTIPVGNIPIVIGITPNGSKAYVGNCNCGIAVADKTDTVSVINVSMNEVTSTIHVGLGPLGLSLAITLDGSKVYVPNSNSSTVSVIDVSIDEVINTLSVGSGPANVAITPDDKKVYVSNYNNPDNPGSTVSVIDVGTNSVSDEVKVGFGPTGMAITPDGSKLYVANFGSISDPGNTVSVVDVETDTETTKIPVGIGPLAIAIGMTPDGPRAYVGNFGSKDSLGHTVSVIDIATDTVVKEVDVGDGPAGIAITTDGSKVYVTNLGGIDDPPDSRAGNTVSVIDTVTNGVSGQPITVGTGPIAVAVTPDGSKAYVANFGSIMSGITSQNVSTPGNTVSVINVRTSMVIDEVSLGSESVGSGPVGIAITPDGSRVYVSNLDSVSKIGSVSLSDPGNTVSVLRAGTNEVIKTITVGNRPFGIAVTHDGTKVYVANYFSGTVSVIDISTNMVTNTIPIEADNELLAGGSGIKFR